MAHGNTQALEGFARTVIARVPEVVDAYRQYGIGEEEFLAYPLMSALFSLMEEAHDRLDAAGPMSAAARDLLGRCADLLEEGIADGSPEIGDLVFIGFLECMFYDRRRRRLASVLGPRCRRELAAVLREMRQRRLP